MANTPQRIISLVPSQTELLFDLGLGERVVGITKFCVHPKEWHQSKKRVGGTKTVRIADVQKLQPDLIIANKEENNKEQVEALQKDFPVWTSDIKSIDDNNQMILSLGEILDAKLKAEEMVEEIQQLEKAFKKWRAEIEIDKSVLYFIWKNPFMVAGKDTFINYILEEVLQLKNAIKSDRYPEIELSKFKLKSEIALLSSEPYPFKEEHLQEFSKELGLEKALLVDGEFFSWYGSRLIKAFPYFKDLLTQIKG